MVIHFALVFSLAYYEYIKDLEYNVTNGFTNIWIALGAMLLEFACPFLLFTLCIGLPCYMAKLERIDMARVAVGRMAPQQREALDNGWESADKIEYKGQIVAVVADHLVLRLKKKPVGWYILPLNCIRTVEIVKDKKKDKNKILIKYYDVILLANGGQPKKYGELLIEKYPDEMLGDIERVIKKAMTQNLEVEPYHIKSKVFDDVGKYGGDQYVDRNAPDYMKQVIKNMISYKYQVPPISNEEYSIYLDRLNSEGCGYVAIINTILVYFEDREQEFLQKFGYPLYAENGDFQFDFLLLDFYTSFDNIQPYSGKRDFKMDYDTKKDGDLDKYNYWRDLKGRGSTTEEREYYVKQFLQPRGIKVEYKTYQDITAFNLKEKMDEGWMIIVALYNGYITRDRENKKVESHAMMVTGVTKTGWFIVSSWGKEYLFHPQKNDSLEFSMVRYK